MEPEAREARPSEVAAFDAAVCLQPNSGGLPRIDDFDPPDHREIVGAVCALSSGRGVRHKYV